MKDQCETIDLEYARCCVSAKVKNNLTAHYYLLMKKKNLMQESFSELGEAEEENVNQKNLIPIP